MDNATSFCLDLQELYNARKAEPVSFQGLLDKYGGTKRDSVTLEFADSSVARWDQTSHSWELNPKD